MEIQGGSAAATADNQESVRPACNVFLSHNSADKILVRDIADRLELEFGLPHFLDEVAIPTGAAFRIWIESALAGSTGCAIFLGANGWGPTHLWEAQRALARALEDPTFRLIPVALPGLEEADTQILADGAVFRDLNWADLRGGLDNPLALDKLHAALTGQALPEGRGAARLTAYQIRRDAARWRRSHQRDASILYRGDQLREAERIAQRFPEITTRNEITPFLLASAAQQRRFWRRAAAGAVITAIVFIGLAGVAERQREIAAQRLALAASRQLTLQSQAAATPTSALLYSVQATAEMATPEAAGNVLEQLQRWPYLIRVLHSPAGPLAALEVSDSRIVAGTRSGTVVRWSRPTLALQGALERMSAGAVENLAELPSEDRIWAALEDGRVLYWRDTTWSPVAGFPPGIDVRGASNDNRLRVGPPVRSLALSPDRSLAAIGTADGTLPGVVQFVDPRTDRVLGAAISLGEPRVNALDFIPGTRTVLAGSGFGRMFLVEAGTAAPVALAGPKLSEVLAVRVVDGGNRLIAVDAVGTVATWRRVSRLSFVFERSVRTVDSLTAAAIAPNGELVALGDFHGVLHLARLDGERPAFVDAPAHAGAIYGITFASDNSILATAGSDGTAAIWDLSRRSVLANPVQPLGSGVELLRPGDNGSLLAARVEVGAAGIWRITDQEPWRQIVDVLAETRKCLGRDPLLSSDVGGETSAPGSQSVPTPEVALIAIDPVARRLVWATRDGALLGRTMSGGETALLFRGGSNEVDALTLGREFVAAAFADRTLRVLDLNSPTKAITTVHLPSAARSIGFDGRERRVAVGLEDGRIGVWSVSGEMLSPPKAVHKAAADHVTFLPNDAGILSNAVVTEGDEVALTVAQVGGQTSTSKVSAATTSDQAEERPLASRYPGVVPAQVAVSAAAGLIATADLDGRVSLWDLSTLLPIATFEATTREITALSISSDGERLVLADGDGQIASWRMSRAGWNEAACRVANRQLTAEELERITGTIVRSACSPP